MAIKVFVVAMCSLAFFGQGSCVGVSCFGNIAALAALGGGEGGLGALAALGGGAGGLGGAPGGFGGAPGGFGGAPGGFGGAPGAFGAPGGPSGLGNIGLIAALGGGEGAGGILRLQLLRQPGFIQQLSQCRLINAVFQG